METRPDQGVSEDTRICLICGQGSRRKDWILKAQRNVEGKRFYFVACDNHGKEKFAYAVSKFVKDVEEKAAAAKKAAKKK
jgi:hypothetical protein